MNEERSVQSCVDIPFRQSLITGLASAILFALGTLGVRRWAGLPYSWVEVVIAAGSAAALGFCGTWLLLLWAMWPKRAQAEQPATVTMAAPAAVPPVAASPRERVIFVHGPSVEDELITEAPEPDAPAGPSQFERFMALAAQGPTSALETKFARAYVQETRDRLIDAGLAQWNGKGRNAGWSLTTRGASVAQRCVGKCGGG